MQDFVQRSAGGGGLKVKFIDELFKLLCRNEGTFTCDGEYTSNNHLNMSHQLRENCIA